MTKLKQMIMRQMNRHSYWIILIIVSIIFCGFSVPEKKAGNGSSGNEFLGTESRGTEARGTENRRTEIKGTKPVTWNI